jgi:hypothetical protein
MRQICQRLTVLLPERSENQWVARPPRPKTAFTSGIDTFTSQEWHFRFASRTRKEQIAAVSALSNQSSPHRTPPTSGYSPCCAGNQTASESCTCEVGESVGIPDHERRGGLGVAQGFETAVVDCEPKDGVARNWRCMTQSECDDHFRPHIAGMRVHVSPRRRGERSPQTLCVRAQNTFLD